MSVEARPKRLSEELSRMPTPSGAVHAMWLSDDQIEIEQSIVGSLFNGDGLTELEFCNLREEVTLMNGGAYSLWKR